MQWFGANGANTGLALVGDMTIAGNHVRGENSHGKTGEGQAWFFFFKQELIGVP